MTIFHIKTKLQIRKQVQIDPKKKTNESKYKTNNIKSVILN